MKERISLVLSSMDSKEIEDTTPTLKEFVVQQGAQQQWHILQNSYLLNCIK